MAGEIKREEEKQVTKPGTTLGKAGLGERGPGAGEQGLGPTVFSHTLSLGNQIGRTWCKTPIQAHPLNSSDC